MKKLKNKAMAVRLASTKRRHELRRKRISVSHQRRDAHFSEEENLYGIYGPRLAAALQDKSQAKKLRAKAQEERMMRLARKEMKRNAR